MPDTDELKAYLANRDVACPGCGANLRGLALPFCRACEQVFVTIDDLRDDRGRIVRIRRQAESVPFAASLLAHLAGRDHPCPGCGHNLRDLELPACPECSRVFTSFDDLEPERNEDESDEDRPLKWHEPVSWGGGRGEYQSPFFAGLAFHGGLLFLVPLGLLIGFVGLNIRDGAAMSRDGFAAAGSGLLAAALALTCRHVPKEPLPQMLYQLRAFTVTWVIPVGAYQAALWLSRDLGPPEIGWAFWHQNP